ncbi:muconolactone Delta-isomerase [Mycetocola spongiae]|uniref:muconolactone Delta-isomerase n=1 Tax=Mycetocola spongiae TaxID=2859226 RepID=UPI001CF15F9A|nr:muconolactone Delta-isomerase family protein [Mycetocola spongiae]UCR88193.1 muconolactone Delta-isomerase family protein [Mycetocola spongiae]
MEFLVEISINLPPETDPALREDLYAREGARAAELTASGALSRIWRVPGRRANWSLYRVADATELHGLLASLPLYAWMDITVHPLATHPADPYRD